MKLSLFDYTDYKAYISQRIKLLEHNGHGSRRKMAEAIQCQTSYISQVLNGSRHLNLEQAEALARYFGLNENESEFFIWLVQYARSGTQGSREFFLKLIQNKKQQNSKLKETVAIKAELSDADKATYYSDFIYPSVHMLASLLKGQTEKSLTTHLGVSEKKIRAVVQFLTAKKLIQNQQGILSAGVQHLFLDRSSSFIVQHHTQYRLRALQSIQSQNDHDVHLSMTVTLSKKDALALKQHISKFIAQSSQLVKKSTAETAMVLNLDFFDL